MRLVPWAAAAILVAAVAALLARPASAQDDPFFGEREILLGQDVHAEFDAGPVRVHRYTLVATRHTRVVAKLRVDAGDALRPSLRLLVPGGRALAEARPVRGRRGEFRLRHVVEFSGELVLEVDSDGGTGAYTLSTGGRLRHFLRGFVPGKADAGSFRFPGIEDARLTATVAPARHGRARPTIVELLDPTNDPVEVTPTHAGRRSTIADVLLPESGVYTLVWESARPGGVRLRFSLRPPEGGAAVLDLGIAEGRPRSLVDKEDADIAALPGYAGSDACQRCHTDVFHSWSDTAHNSFARTWDRPGLTGRPMTNDANRNGVDDFRDGLDLATVPAFAAFGSNAPKLLHVAGDPHPYKVRIGATTYDVHRTMGGNGLWLQRYLTRIGRSFYVLPFEYDDGHHPGDGVYLPYETATWYDVTAPRAVVPGVVPEPARSLEAQCSGCHATAESLSSDAGEVLIGHQDVNIGCEQCHGPGAAHAARGDPSLIVNPRSFLDGTAAGVRRANDVCSRCHTIGTSVDPLPGVGVHAQFGFRADRGVAKFGDDPDDFLVPTTDPAEFVGWKANPFPGVPGPTFIASRRGQQPQREMDQGPHGTNRGSDPSCIECHDPHARRNEHQVATRVDRGGRVATRLEDNTLCLACHAGQDVFADVPVADVSAISRGPVPASVRAAVTDHMRDIGMGVPQEAYDPTGTGVGRCDFCHMATIGGTGGFGTDAKGFALGDKRDHSVEAKWPNVGLLYGVTNSCSRCHPTGEDDRAAMVIDEWAGRGRDGDGLFHADTPRSFQNGARNADDGGPRCAGCHTTAGFVRIQVQGEALDQPAIDAILHDSLQRDVGITCRACHGRNSEGTFAVGTQQPLRFPKAELCGRCHNDATLKFDDFLENGELVRHPQREMLDGSAGAEPPDAGTWRNSGHTSTAVLPDRCVGCHYDPTHADAQHDFAPQILACAQCHAGLTTFNRTARADYDGDGAREGVQDEVLGLLGHVRNALLADPNVTFDGRFFDYAGARDHRMTGASEAQKRAAFNYTTVVEDQSFGVHNAARTVQLLQRSYRELTGEDVPGAVLR